MPRRIQMDGVIMTPRATVGIVGIIVGLILLIILPSWLIWVGAALIAAAVAIPVAGYLALDKSQRRRIRAIRARQRDTRY
jgi:Na+/H+-translocating membrane pyrophosphatase